VKGTGSGQSRKSRSGCTCYKLQVTTWQQIGWIEQAPLKSRTNVSCRSTSNQNFDFSHCLPPKQKCDKELHKKICSINAPYVQVMIFLVCFIHCGKFDQYTVGLRWTYISKRSSGSAMVHFRTNNCFTNPISFFIFFLKSGLRIEQSLL
jgi:hypothetical protein